MNASVEWLSAFVDSGLSPERLRDLITARVATVDAVEVMRTDLASIVVGRVVEAARHPDSDHLWVTKVDAGGAELVDVICGAPNVTAGERYPFAPVGTTMPNGMKIERRKIRGQVSSGMLCSARELGLGTDHEGIFALSTDAAPGTPLLEALAVGDVRLVVDVMPNRPDLLSHLGLAREIAAATGRPLRGSALPVGDLVAVPNLARSDRSALAGDVRVTVDDPFGLPDVRRCCLPRCQDRPEPGVAGQPPRDRGHRAPGEQCRRRDELSPAWLRTADACVRPRAAGRS